MKVYININKKSFALNRIYKALKKYKLSNIDIVDNENEADLVVISVTGRKNHIYRYIEYLKTKGNQYAIIQCCLKSTLNPKVEDWLSIWKSAKIVWSYYDFRNYINNFYYAPLGVDSIFRKINLEKKYIICTSGRGYLQESVRECIFAARNVRKKVFHIGKELNRENVDCFSDINDEELVKLYNQCEYVSGLRREEGFELPAAEAICCGVRPIVFDKPHYKQWYDGLAEFIPETNRDGIVNDLTRVFSKSYMPVSNKDIEEAKRRFNWEEIITNFWKKCL